MILVTGGSGFIGPRLVARLGEGGRVVRALARGQRRADLPAGVETATGNVVSGEGLPEAMAGVERVVHLVAIIREGRGQTFDGVIRRGTERVVEAALAAGVQKLVYVSAIGARDDPTYPYLVAKWRAEQAVINSGLNYAILRPSIIFGVGDEFINALAGLARRPVVPIAGDGRSKFQPLWVEDLVSCIVASLDGGAHDREIVEVGGPEQFTYEELVDEVMRELGVSRRKVHVPLALMKPLAAVMGVLPRPPVTVEQLKMLALDNVTEPDAVQKAFGFPPRRLADGIGYVSTRG